MAYVALYRRWRPSDFDTLVGQKAVKIALTNALESGRIAHAYLFSGPRGTGKTSTARIFAKALNCEHGPTAHPCGKCQNCQEITDGTSMDVFEMDAASNRGIDDIKALRERLLNRSYNQGSYKVYIIDEVHMLTTESFNALLKTLEEPPDNVIFILATTDPQKVPATIHSRCQRFDFRRITVEEITDHLEMVATNSGLEAEREALRLMAIQSEGGMRDALSLLDQCGVMSKHITVDTVQKVLGIVGRTALRQLVESIGKQDLSQALANLNKLLEQGKDVGQVLVELAEYLRALLLFKSAPSYDEVYLTDSKESLEQLAPLFGRDRLMAAEERLHGAIYELKGTMRPRITGELCLFDLCRLEGSTIAALQARIEQLEQRISNGDFITAAQRTADNDVPAPISTTQYIKPMTAQTVALQNQQQFAPAPHSDEAMDTAKASAVDVKNIPADKICDFDIPDAMYEDDAYITADELAMATNKPPAQVNKQTKLQEPTKPANVSDNTPKATAEMVQAIQTKASVVNNANAKAAAPAKSTGSTVVEYGGDWALGEEYWKKALEILAGEKKISVVSCAKGGRAIGYENGILRVAFKAEFTCKRMSKKDYCDMVEDALLRIARQEIRLECITEAELANMKSNPTVQPKASVKKEEPKVDTGGLPDNVRKAMDVFGGSIHKL